MTITPSPEAGEMDESPEEWLERLFEYEFCAEWGGDAADHEVCIVPGIGNYFARCKRPAEGCDGTAHPQATDCRTEPTVSGTA